jgi:hypothetical protein
VNSSCSIALLRVSLASNERSGLASQSRVTNDFMPPLSVQKEFKVSEFPGVEPALQACVDEAVNLLVECIRTGANVTG